MSKLELLATSPGTGKTTYCIDLFRKEILKSPAGLDSRAYFVLPNREHAGRIQNLVLKKDTPGLFNVHILTIQELSKRLTGGAALPQPGESMRRSVLRYLVEDPAETWEYFAPVKDLPGFYELLSERIQEFRQSMLTVEEFEKRAGRAGRDPVFHAKAADFMRLMRRYDEELEARGFAETAPDGRTLRFNGEAPLVILDGFYHFTRSQRALIEVLAKGGARMLATLTLPEGHEKRGHVFELVENTRAFLENTGFKPSQSPPGKSRRVDDRALLHLECSLFLPKPGKLTGKQDSIRLLTAETVHDEVEGIAREIRRLHRDTDWHYSDMAVILRSVQGYDKSIAAVFEEYGIPVSVHERRKTLETGLGRFTHRLLSLFISDWQTADLFSILRSGYSDFRPAPEAVAALERAAFAGNVRGGREAWQGLAQDPACRPVQQALAELSGFEKRLMEARSARVFRLMFAAFLRTCRLDASAGDGAALRAVENLLARAETLYAGKSGQVYSAVRFAEEFQRAIEVGLFSERPSGKNRVQVYDAVMALPKEYRVVFVAGLLDQRFPKPVNEDPFFKDEERARLNGKEPLLELLASRRSGERYFFYMAVTRARNRLYLSYPQKDRDGKPYLPSAFIDEVRRCFTELPLLENKAGAAAPALWVAETEAEKGAAEMLFTRENTLSKDEKKQLLAYAAHKRGQRRFARVIEAGLHKDAALLSDPRIVEAIRKETQTFSATRLESFLTCSFKHYADYSLKLKPYLEDRLRAETGTLLHAVLEDFYAKKRNASQLFEELAREFEKSPLSSEPPYRRHYLLERARRTLALFLRFEEKSAENGFVPSHFELAFGKKRDGSPAELPYLKLGKDVQIGGFIDRIDISEDRRRALVVDYKLGTRDLKKKVEQGLEVQLPLYLMAARDLLKLDPYGAELHFLESGKKSALKSETLGEFLKETETRVLDAAQRIRSGDIAVRSKSCQHCNFATLCRYETWKLIYAEADRV